MNGHDNSDSNITISVSHLFVVKKKGSQTAMLLSHVVPHCYLTKIKNRNINRFLSLCFFEVSTFWGSLQIWPVLHF